MRKLCVALMLSAALSAAPSLGPVAWAQSPTPQERAEDLARESLEMLLRALDAMVDAVPQYALPEITEDGDIIIRRIRPGDDDGRDERDERDEDRNKEPDTDET
ncbi:MAG: hypothetical protein ACTSX7_14945 [Alphaproteobacteria bacterium]